MSHIDFHYQKAPDYRTIHADGFYGGVTPRGYISMSFFSERSPIPRQARREILSSEGGVMQAGPESIIESLKGIVRIIDTTVMMDLNTAREFQEWFEGHLRNLEAASAGQSIERLNGEEPQ